MFTDLGIMRAIKHPKIESKLNVLMRSLFGRRPA